MLVHKCGWHTYGEISFCDHGFCVLREIVTKKIKVDGVDISYDVTGCGRHTLFLLPGALGLSYFLLTCAGN